MSAVGNVGFLSDSREFIFSLRGPVWLAGKLFLFVAAILLYRSGNLLGTILLDPDYGKPPTQVDDVQQATGTNINKQELSEFNIVKTRNVFGTKATTTEAPAPKSTNLKLRLVGTSVSTARAPFAIIENKSKNEQDVFEANDKIFDQAKLVEIMQDSVRIENQGKFEILYLEDGVSQSPSTDSAVSNNGGNDYQISEEELGNALANLPALLSQARAVPYFRNGQSIGMRLFAIRRDSLYEKLGLKNGDIVLAVNDASLSDPAQALKIWEELKQQKSVVVKIERSGETTDLNYAIR